jgi:cytochrome c-type biogenesis protein
VESVSLLDAFVAGVLSFISPGVVPLVPGYLAFIFLNNTSKRQVILTSLIFILGFSLVFVSLGASATFLGQFLLEWLTLFGMIAGIVVIVVGLQAIGVIKIPFRGPVIVGSSFAFGWTPCLGPVLSAILLVAAQPDLANQGILLLSAYSMGLAIPFLLTALAINQLFAASKIRRHHHTIEIASGVLMIVVGVLLFTNRFTIIAQWLTPYLPTF